VIVFTTDVSGLYAERLKLSNPADHAVLPEVISKEAARPDGCVMAMTNGFDIMKWVLFAMVDAEELGVTQKKNVDDHGQIGQTRTQAGRFGHRRQFSANSSGLTKDWVSRIVKGGRQLR